MLEPLNMKFKPWRTHNKGVKKIGRRGKMRHRSLSIEVYISFSLYVSFLAFYPFTDDIPSTITSWSAPIQS